MSASIHKIESLSMTNSARRSSRWPRTFRSYGANHLQPIANANAWCGCCWKISPWSVGTTLLTVEEMAKVLDIHPRVKIWNRHGPIRGHAYNGKNDSLCEGPGTSRATHTAHRDRSDAPGRIQASDAAKRCGSRRSSYRLPAFDPEPSRLPDASRRPRPPLCWFSVKWRQYLHLVHRTQKSLRSGQMVAELDGKGSCSKRKANWLRRKES